MVSAATVFLTHIICDETEKEGGFVVDEYSSQPDVPYGKTFFVHVQYVFEWKSAKQTRVRISCEVNFLPGKRPGGFISNMVNNGVVKGVGEASGIWVETLQSAGGSPRRRKKGDTFQRGRRCRRRILISILVFVGCIGFALGLLLDRHVVLDFFSRLARADWGSGASPSSSSPSSNPPPPAPLPSVSTSL